MKSVYSFILLYLSCRFLYFCLSISITCNLISLNWIKCVEACFVHLDKHHSLTELRYLKLGTQVEYTHKNETWFYLWHTHCLLGISEVFICAVFFSLLTTFSVSIKCILPVEIYVINVVLLFNTLPLAVNVLSHALSTVFHGCVSWSTLLLYAFTPPPKPFS